MPHMPHCGFVTHLHPSDGAPILLATLVTMLVNVAVAYHYLSRQIPIKIERGPNSSYPHCSRRDGLCDPPIQTMHSLS